MSVVPELLGANKLYAASFDKAELPRLPRRQVAVLTCMDARIDPAKALGLVEGDAHVIRNAGGRATDDAIRSLAVSSTLLGTREVVVVHHTDCGMANVTNDEVRDRLRREWGIDASGVDFLPIIADLDRSLREYMTRIRRSPLLPSGIPVHGFVYDVHTGRLREVAHAAP